MIVDANLYWFPERCFTEEAAAERFLAEVPRYYGTNGFLQTNANGVKQIVIEKPTGYPSLNYVQGDYELERILADLDRAGVDKAVLKLPGCAEWMSLETCRAFNDGMADYARRSGGRLVPLGVVPPQASAGVFAEVERCRSELGITHFQLASHYGSCYLDAPCFAAFFAKLNEQPTTLYIHHSPVPVEYGSIYEYNNLRRSYGRCADQTIAICREVFSGFFEKYPNLKLVHSMLGGGFFALAEMMFPPQPKTTDQAARFATQPKSVKQAFTEHIYFEMSHAQPWGQAALECAVRVLGADHIVFGSSYPVRQEWLTEGPAFVRGLAINEEEKTALLGGNAMRLYGIRD